MGKSKELLCQEPIDKPLTKSSPTASLTVARLSLTCSLPPFPSLPMFFQFPVPRLQVAKNDSYTGVKLIKWVEREQWTKVSRFGRKI